MLHVMSNAVEIASQVKIRRACSSRCICLPSCQHMCIGERPQFSITNAKLNAQHNVHMLRVGYELGEIQSGS